MTQRHDAPLDPPESPVSLLGNARDGVHRAKQVVLLHRVLDVRLQQQAVHLCAAPGHASDRCLSSACRVTLACSKYLDPCMNRTIVWTNIISTLNPAGCLLFSHGGCLVGQAGQYMPRTGVDVLDGDLEAIERPSLRKTRRSLAKRHRLNVALLSTSEWRAGASVVNFWCGVWHTVNFRQPSATCRVGRSWPKSA